MGQTYPVICLGQIMSQSSDGDACGYHMMEAEGVQSPSCCQGRSGGSPCPRSGTQLQPDT